MAPASAPAPPALPPSVEEAYRRKCIQLKQRTSQVEEANDAARLRLSRLKRQCEKMRLERAFLLEQLAKRTSTNVEDSDGSPSPPPTPKEKPLRIKRGHRKPSMLTSFDTPPAGPASSVAGGNEPTGRAGSSAFLGGGANNLRQTQSPSSDAFSTQPSKANGLRFGPAPRKPATAFDLYSAEARAQSANGGDKDDRAEEELARGWKGLESHERMAFESRAEVEMEQYQKEKLAYDDDAAAYQKEKDAYDDEANASATKSGNATEEVDMDVDEADGPRRGSGSGTAAAAARAKDSAPVGDDTEMNYDTDPDETQVDKQDD